MSQTILGQCEVTLSYYVEIFNTMGSWFLYNGPLKIYIISYTTFWMLHVNTRGIIALVRVWFSEQRARGVIYLVYAVICIVRSVLLLSAYSNSGVRDISSFSRIVSVHTLPCMW